MLRFGWILSASLFWLLLLGACSPLAPCSVCPDLSGRYTVRAQPIDPLGSSTSTGASCASLAFTGADEQLELTQSASSLTTTGWLSFEGTLYEDRSVVLGPRLYGQSSDGEVQITVTGLFTQARDGWVMQGQAIFEILLQGCRIDTPVDLTQTPGGG